MASRTLRRGSTHEGNRGHMGEVELPPTTGRHEIQWPKCLNRAGAMKQPLAPEDILGNASLHSCQDGISESSRITTSSEGYRSRFRILPWMSAPIPTRMLLELLCYPSICTGGSRVLTRGLSLRIRQGNGGNFLRMVGRVARLLAVEWGIKW